MRILNTLLKLFLSKMNKTIICDVRRIAIAVCAIAVCLLMVSFLSEDYLASETTSGHISLAITIITTVLVGGCILVFVENQHVVGDVTNRFQSVMRPFYKKLTNYAKFATRCILAISASDKEGRDFKKRKKENSKDIQRIASQAILSGDNIPYLEAKELDIICERINKVWYMCERNYDKISHLTFDNDFQKDEIRDALIEYDRTYSKEEINVFIFPKVSGDFYVKVWQPVQNVSYVYEHFMVQCSNSYKWLVISIMIEIVCLLFVLFSDSIGCASSCSIDFQILTSVAAFILSLLKFTDIKLQNFILSI